MPPEIRIPIRAITTAMASKMTIVGLLARYSAYAIMVVGELDLYAVGKVHASVGQDSCKHKVLDHGHGLR